jgi:tetratricopeptide (TPR) repeat protein
MPEASEYKYQAFLSYSHHDARAAERLQYALEHFRIDRDLVGRVTPAGPIPQRMRVFRDRSDLSAGHSLPGLIEAELAASKFLIVLCSPEAAASRYVDQEVARFKAQGRADRVLALILSGEPGKPQEECFPPALRFKVGPDGTVSSEREEPIAADARPQGDGRDIARLKLVGGLLGLSLDEVVRRDRIAQRRQTRMWLATSAAMLLLAMGAGIGAVVALEQRRQTKDLLVTTLRHADQLVTLAVDSSRRRALPASETANVLKVAEDLLADLEKRDQSHDVKRRTAAMLMSRARNYAAINQSDQQLAYAERALLLTRALLRQSPDLLKARLDAAQAHGLVGDAQLRRNRVLDAIAAFEAAVALLDGVRGRDRDGLEAVLEWASRRMALGRLLAQTRGDPLPALQFYHEAIDVLAELARGREGASPASSALADAHTGIGQFLTTEHSRDIAQAMGHLRKALDIRERLLIERDDVGQMIKLAELHLSIGDVEVRTDNKPAAEIAFGRSLELREQLVQRDPTNILFRSDLGFALVKAGDRLADKDPELGRQHYLRSVEMLRGVADADRQNASSQLRLALAYRGYGQTLHHLARYAEALEAYEAALAVLDPVVRARSALPHPRSDVALTLDRIGNVHLSMKDPVRALDAFRKSLAIKERLVEDFPRDEKWRAYVAQSHQLLAGAHWRAHDLVSAGDSLESALAIRRRLVHELPDDRLRSRDLAWLLVHLASLRITQHRPAAALQLFLEARDLALARSGPEQAFWRELATWTGAEIAALEGVLKSPRTDQRKAIMQWRKSR